MRISVQLINAADRFQVWSEKYDTDLRDLFDIQDEITESVIDALKPKFRSKESLAVDKTAALIAELQQHAGSIEAYQLYLRGRFHFNKLTPDGFYLALESFQKALAMDPGFAAAHAGIADAHIFSSELGRVPPLEAMPKAKQAALEALRLDPANAEAHMSLAFIHQEFDYDFESAEREYKKAIELNPNAPMAHQYYGALLSQLGRQTEAEGEFRRANVLDPLSPASNWIRPLGLFFARRYDECIELTDNLLGLDADFPAAHLVASFGYQMQEDFARSVAAYTRFLELCGLSELAEVGRQSYEAGGWPSFLQTMTSPESRPLITAYITAVFFEALSEHDQALAMLEESFNRREGHMVMLNVDPRFQALREDTRFKELLKKVGFPDQ
jgi:tetratricopeptide (TPR) repeat protein